MDAWGKLSMSMVQRFTELTKTELIVLMYLLVRRNNHTRQCNPRRRTIAAETKIAKPHVCTAIRDLEKKGWIQEIAAGQFLLVGTESVPIPPLIPVQNPYQNGTESVPKRYEMRTAHIKEGNREETEKEQNKDTWVSEIFAEWQKVLNHPRAKLDKNRRTRINARINEGFTLDELKSVPRGVLRSPYHMGINKSGIRYTKISTIYRDQEQVEGFIELANTPFPERSNGYGTDGARLSEREKSAQRGSNAVAAIAELKRLGQAEQALSGRDNGTGAPIAFISGPTEPH